MENFFIIMTGALVIVVVLLVICICALLDSSQKQINLYLKLMQQYNDEYLKIDAQYKALHDEHEYLLNDIAEMGNPKDA